MSVELLKFFLDIFVILFISLSVCLVLALAVHPFVPKAMLETYFKPPYFSRGEVVAFTGFPLGYIRTAMFMRLAGFPRSEEHTSELQSRGHLVCRLLLEKKKHVQT